VLSSSYPHSLLFIGAGQLREEPRAPSECDEEPTRSSHVEGQDEPSRGGSADLWGRTTPGWARHGCAFSMWLSGGSLMRFGCPRGLEAVWTRRWANRIHVMRTRWLLIRRVFFPWIDDIVDPVDAYMAASYWLSLNCLDHEGVLSSLFLC
jgi:hypothetical protein